MVSCFWVRLCIIQAHSKLSLGQKKIESVALPNFKIQEATGISHLLNNFLKCFMLFHSTNATISCFKMFFKISVSNFNRSYQTEDTYVLFMSWFYLKNILICEIGVFSSFYSTILLELWSLSVWNFLVLLEVFNKNPFFFSISCIT